VQLANWESQDFKVWGRDFQAKSDFCNEGSFLTGYACGLG